MPRRLAQTIRQIQPHKIKVHYKNHATKKNKPNEIEKQATT
jgi:hypothetical protein